MSDESKQALSRVVQWTLSLVGAVAMVLWLKADGAAPRGDLQQLGVKLDQLQRTVDNTRLELGQRITRVETQMEALKR